MADVVGNASAALAAAAQEAVDPLTALQNGVNTFFLLVMGMIVFLMQCGFAFLEAGSVRSKNTTNILIKNLLDSCICALCYWAVGWALAYGDNSVPVLQRFCGLSDFFSYGMDPNTDYASWFFQFSFAAAASTIVSGALAERCEFVAYFVYCASLTSFVYPIITHWAWHEDGWLKQGPADDVSYVDFAGSGVVHLHGGSCALIGALLLGPRIGRFTKDNVPAYDLKGHSVPFAALGGFLLMFGFFAFNGGSQLSITNPGDAMYVALAIKNTILSGGAAGLTTLVIFKVINKKWSLLATINAVLTGMVSACAGCNAMQPWAAIVVGAGAGISYFAVANAVAAIKVDDPLDAVGVHAGGGFWGLFITPWLIDGGIVWAWNGRAFAVLGWNMVGAVAIIAWSIITMGIVFGALRLCKSLRVPKDIEIRGLDMYKHGEAAYPLVAYGSGWPELMMSDPTMSPAERHRRVSQALDVGQAAATASALQQRRGGGMERIDEGLTVTAVVNGHKHTSSAKLSEQHTQAVDDVYGFEHFKTP